MDLRNKKKITKATVKTFIKKYQDNLYIRVNSSFDGMYDCVMTNQDKQFSKARMLSPEDRCYDYRLGVEGAWFVGDSRDYFELYEDNRLIGIEVYNSCGGFVLAREKTDSEILLTQLVK